MTRTILRISGDDRVKFLHGLLTRDVPETGLGYAALLSPQGKYLADFLTFADADALYLDYWDEVLPPVGVVLDVGRGRERIAAPFQ